MAEFAAEAIKKELRLMVEKLKVISDINFLRLDQLETHLRSNNLVIHGCNITLFIHISIFKLL